MDRDLSSATVPFPGLSTKSLILIVDDVPENLQVLAGHLSGVGYEVMPATSGAKALLFARARVPDLVLLDISMPEMDGFEVCRCLKNLPAVSAVPVLFITARTAAEDVVRGFDAGGVDYITKPFNSAELLARVRTHLELKAARDALLKYNAELSRQSDELRRLDADKNHLLSVVSHDMRGSFGNVISLCDTLLEPDADATLPREERAEMLHLVAREAEHMILLGQNLLDAHAIGRGAFRLRPETLDPVEAMTFVVHKHRRTAALKGLSIGLVNANPGTFQVCADRTALIQVLDNLLSNAVKYSPPGGTISLTVRSRPDYIGLPPGVRLAVEDDGPGLSAEDQARLFHEFTPLTPRPTSPGEHSVGLGLAIVKRMTQAMHGEVGYEPGPGGRGSRFYVELPC